MLGFWALFLEMSGLRAVFLEMFRRYAFLIVLDGIYLSEILKTIIIIKLSYKALEFQRSANKKPNQAQTQLLVIL